VNDATALIPSPGPLGQEAGLDRGVDVLERVAGRVAPPGPRRAALQGDWLGHPVHPALTDLVIGFWTSAFVLDLLPVRRLRAASDAFVALGLAAALPTVATGLADWTALDRENRRIGVVHAGANAAATGCYALSLLARVRGRRVRGVALSTLGAAAATVGGYLGGHLAFGAEKAAEAVPAEALAAS
jgi:uncharacterized membrane protein